MLITGSGDSVVCRVDATASNDTHRLYPCASRHELVTPGRQWTLANSVGRSAGRSVVHFAKLIRLVQ
ncbi:hypothetical protein RDWZM_002015 [Blomia tropicalis]|uniref:Uncharacterized protein n=1 Tax=Blomia tropicalis TaxID=40697 RepID=A0A9Q0MCP5_BLOTA|nr:hypothetical protein RDWZM_002015 [Blomia tropicalis]